MSQRRVAFVCAAVLASVGCSNDSQTSIPSWDPDAGSPGGGAGFAGSGPDAAVDHASAGTGGADSGVDAPKEAPTPTAPHVVFPGDQVIDEDQTLSLSLQIDGSEQSGLRVTAGGLPPGARFDEVQRKLVFTPDFIQGGETWTVQITARNSVGSDTASFSIKVNDSIHPPWPSISKTEDAAGYKSVWLSQSTDEYLDSPGYAGRTFTARVIVPDAATDSSKVPVRVYLHGLGGSPYDGTSSDGQFRIYPHDPMNTYWWGYASSLPDTAPSGNVPNYTQRRVLHLLEWVLRMQKGADSERVYVSGGSMGGAGAAELGLLYARHFAYLEATWAQMIPRNHRPSRIKQLTGLWGAPDANLPDATALEDGVAWGVWDRQDLSRVLRDSVEARQQHVFTKHGKDDSTIHFGAMTLPSPITNRSLLDALREGRVGHYVVWDEGGHGPADPVMEDGWWDHGWSRIFDSKAYLRSDLPYPAFSFASHDWDPGDGTGNGKEPWSDESGYAGTVAVAGDTGWTGDLAGARNRFLRWDSSGIVDGDNELRIPLFVVDGQGAAAPKAGYPSTGDRFDRTLPVVVDVTVRRARGFLCPAGEQVAWSFGAASGIAIAGQDGSVTVMKLPIGKDATTLVLSR